MKRINLYLLVTMAMLMLSVSSAWAGSAYVKVTAEDGIVSWVRINGTINGTNIEIYKGEWESAIEKNTKGSIDLNEVWSESGGIGTHYQVTCIREYAFSHCSSLTSITIPFSVTRIGKYAFSNCRDLTSIEIPSSVTSIGYQPFLGCIHLATVTINSNAILSLSYSAESNIGNIFGSQVTKYILGEGVTSIGNVAFYGCSGLTSVVIPNSVTNIGVSAFSGCSGLTSIEIPNSVTSIEDFVFYDCSGLTSVVIPNSVTSIGMYAFSGCSGLTSFVIPNSVTSIGLKAFSGCSGLTSIVVESGNSVYDSRNNCNAIIETASNTLLAGFKNTKIPSSVTSIGNFAFFDCSSLTSFVIPNSVTSIGIYAFYDCSGLTSIEIPNSVTSIGDYAFSGCSGLTSIEIPNSVTSIETYVFRGCSGLTSIEIPSSVTTIRSEAFSGCSGLTSITSYITDVFATGVGAFSGCDNATLYVPKGLSNFYRITVDWNRIKKIEEIPAIAFTMSCNKKGSVLVNDETVITNKIAEVELKDNEESTFVFIPRENCKLDEVTLNGVDLISLVENNTLKAVIPDNSQMNVVFSKYANLTVKQGTTGYTRQAVKADARHTIFIGSLGENKVNTVTFNGVDVTDEVVNGYYTTPEIKGESVLSISFETNLSVKSMSLNELKVMGYNGEIQIKNIDEPSDVFVYTVDGKLVGNVPSAYGSTSIQVASEELYVVKVGSRVFKVAL
jgi:hypothetical protein